MAERRTSHSTATARRMTHKPVQSPLGRRFSALTGGALIALALFWFAWLLVHQINPPTSPVTFPVFSSPLQSQSPTPVLSPTPGDPLAAAGITLTSPGPDQGTVLTKQQALFQASQLEPAASSSADSAVASYTLFSYSSADAGQKSFHNIPVWLIHYSKVAEPRPDTSADPQASRGTHDFYVFLDAHSGLELLTIWS